MRWASIFLGRSHFFAQGQNQLLIYILQPWATIPHHHQCWLLLRMGISHHIIIRVYQVFFFNFWKISSRKMIRCSSLFSPWNFVFFGHHLETEIDQIEVIIPSLIKAHKLFDLGAVWIKVQVNRADKSYFLGIWQPHHKAIVRGWKCMNAFRQYSSN